MTDKHPIIMIHGYNHNPRNINHSAARIPDGHFYIWGNIFSKRSTIPFHWYSGRKWRDVFKAWANGEINSYAYAYEHLSIHAADNLWRMVIDSDKKFDIVCHSLGARVALSVMDRVPNCFRRVMFLNGAESREIAGNVFRKNNETEILNVAVSTDDVLGKVGRWRVAGGCMGQQGIPNKTENIYEVFLDDANDQIFLKDLHGWEIEGDNPDKIGDHSYSFKNPKNHALMRYFMENGSL